MRLYPVLVEATKRTGSDEAIVFHFPIFAVNHRISCWRMTDLTAAQGTSRRAALCAIPRFMSTDVGSAPETFDDKSLDATLF
jgi:hypothetical protein